MSLAIDKGSEPAAVTVPPLEGGDGLTRAEFERRYQAMPHVKKAELIEGVVYMPSPARIKKHGVPQSGIVGWLLFYAAHTPGVEVADNATVRLDLDNEPQPDVLLRILPEAGGQTSDSADDYVEGAPELAAEVASSSASYDLHQKKHAYRRNKVREYLVWVTEEPRLHWWELRNEQYLPLEPDAQGIIKSGVFPGLWLDVAALLRKDFARVLEIVAQGVVSGEHKTFVAQLGEALKRK
ncbi:MAG: Uma2 family endonuclease [Verrucomicrobia bacterium]|nr:Uma2 family endonuclease [Verrucomicrobiota bacterium]